MTGTELVENTEETASQTPEEAVIVVAPETTPEPAKSNEPDPRDAEIEALKRETEETKRRLADTEAKYQSLQSEKSSTDNKLAGEVASRFAAQEGHVAARIERAATGLAAAKAEQVRAWSEQRYEDAANFSEAIADYKTELKAAEWDKANIQTQKQRVAEEIQIRQVQRQSDPVEVFLSRIPGEVSRNWLRSHPELLQKVANNANEAKKLFAYAQLAESEGNIADTPQYLDFVEEKLGMKQPQTQIQPAREQRVNKTSSAAPSSNTTPSSPVPRTIKLDDVVKKLTVTDRANARTSFPNHSEDEALKLFAQGLVISKQREPNFRPDIRL